MTEADVRNAGMSKETEDDFRQMTYVQRVFLFASIARNMYSACNLEFKTWKQQVSRLLESDTLSDHERADVIRTEHTAECEEENARRAQNLIQFEDEDAKVLILKSIMSETLIGEAGAFEDRHFDTNIDLFVVITRYLSNKKVGVNDEIRLASISTILVQDAVEREERVHWDKGEDSIAQDFFCHVSAIQARRRQG